MPARALHDDSVCLTFQALQVGYHDGARPPADLLATMHERADTDAAAGVWIHRASESDLHQRLAELERQRAAGARLPLFGLPFAVKDNIDVAGMPTSAACPAFTYTPKRSATAVQRLVDAGAIVLGKTNLDQFATGLVGVRSPYGVPRNPFDPRYIPGGSSSGSAVAVAAGMAAFALGTDTAGSGRVPAAFNNIVGLKPSRGLLSATGVVPACRSLDCVSIFALTCADAWQVFQILCHYDEMDPFARAWDDLAPTQVTPTAASFRFGVPGAEQLEFFGDAAAKAAFSRALDDLEALGGRPVEVDLAPFRAAAQLLYDGPWVAERLAAAGEILAAQPEALDPAVHSILRAAGQFDAQTVFHAQAQLGALRQQTKPVWKSVDVLVLPTAPTIYTIAQVQADPLSLNSKLGTYTNFVNLLDLCALAVPAGFGADGLPFGITLVAPCGHDERLAMLGARFHAATSTTLGASSQTWAGDGTIAATPRKSKDLLLAVVGAHLSGEPLNHQLTDLGATLIKTAWTSPHYRLFALANTAPAKPGLVRSTGSDGAAVEVEVWQLSHAATGALLADVVAPLCIGHIELENGEWVHGFLCEGHATARARDITAFGGWRPYRRSLDGEL